MQKFDTYMIKRFGNIDKKYWILVDNVYAIIHRFEDQTGRKEAEL
jgi:hypothetical protein